MTPATVNKLLLAVALATAIVLFVPAVALQFTPEVAWGPGDFLVAGLLVSGAGTLAVLGWHQVNDAGRRAALIAAIVGGLLLVWAELAVGLFS